MVVNGSESFLIEAARDPMDPPALVDAGSASAMLRTHIAEALLPTRFRVGDSCYRFMIPHSRKKAVV